MSGTELRPRQALFAREYLVDLNATQAAIRAGYSPATARQMGAENLTKPVIARAVAAAQRALSERIEITQDDIVRGLHREATRTGEGTSHAARVAAWTALGRHLGMFTEKVDLRVQDGLTAKLDAALKLQREVG
jgi:phage terminase small subunit